jgi:hypothetical protein
MHHLSKLFFLWIVRSFIFWCLNSRHGIKEAIYSCLGYFHRHPVLRF